MFIVIYGLSLGLLLLFDYSIWLVVGLFCIWNMFVEVVIFLLLMCLCVMVLVRLKCSIW